LHKIYESLVTNPPDGVEYVVPPTLSKFTKYYAHYKKVKFLPGVKHAVRIVEKKLFLPKESDDSIDLYQYINIIDDNPPDKPYIVDIEHAASLVSFVPDQGRIRKVLKFLQNPNCKAVECMSGAAMRTLEQMLGDDYGSIAKKVKVLYPAVPEADDSIKPDDEYIKKSTSVKMLFVGNQAYLKGLEEVLEALKRLKIGSDKLELHVISNDGKPVVEQYGLKNVRLYEPKFPKHEIISKFYLPADVFIMPTKEDTFGLAILDALSCGTAVITTKQFAMPELVTDGVDGMLVKIEKPLLDTVIVPNKEDMASVTEPNLNEGMVEKLMEVFEKILSGKIDLKKLGKAGKKKFTDGGRFSVSTRNKELLKTYKQALKS
jgi:glycosyltransferase involved in cell wall biosynthesis